MRLGHTVVEHTVDADNAIHVSNLAHVHAILAMTPRKQRAGPLDPYLPGREQAPEEVTHAALELLVLGVQHAWSGGRRLRDQLEAGALPRLTLDGAEPLLPVRRELEGTTRQCDADIPKIERISQLSPGVEGDQRVLLAACDGQGHGYILASRCSHRDRLGRRMGLWLRPHAPTRSAQLHAGMAPAARGRARPRAAFGRRLTGPPTASTACACSSRPRTSRSTGCTWTSGSSRSAPRRPPSTRSSSS